MYVQINIDRNIGKNPMTQRAWYAYQEEVRDALQSSTLSALPSIFDAYHESHYGTGRWWDVELQENVIAESVHISFFDAVGFDLDRLRSKLQEIKVKYRQDSIALITSSDLI